MLLKRAAFGLLFAVACSPCGQGVSVAGDTPYQRCMATEPTAPPASVGVVRLTLQDRVLTLDGLPATPRIAVFQGPGMVTVASAADVLRSISADKPDLLLMLGGLGVESKATPAWLTALLKAGPPMLFLPGGRDSLAAAEAALSGLGKDERHRFVDLTGIHVMNLSGYVVQLVAGADSGREAIDEKACGFSDDDITQLSDLDEGKQGLRHILVSWEIPASSGASGGPGFHPGSSLLRDPWEKAGFVAGIHAWPDTHVMRPVTRAGASVVWGQAVLDLEVSVPRLLGPPHERSDGTRQLPGYLGLRLEKAGIVAEKPH